MRDKAVAPKVRYVKPNRDRPRGAPVDLNIPPVWESTPNPPDAVEGENYRYNLRSHLNTGFGVVITVTNGALPTGLSIDGLSIVGVPTAPGTFANIQLTATNTEGSDESDAFDIAIAAFAWTSTPNPPDGNTGVPYPSYDMAQHLNSSEGVTLSTANGALPAGLSYSGTRIVGTPTTVENQSEIRTTADNGTASDTSLTYGIRIAFGVVQWTSTPAPQDAVVGDAYSYDLTQHLNGTENVTVDVLSGSLPPGLSINNTTYVIEGTPTQSGNFNNIRLRATSPFNNDISGFFNMTVLAAPPDAPVWTTDPPSLPPGVVGQPYNYDFTGDLSTTEGVVITQTGTGSLPDGVSISGLTLTGTPTIEGTFANLQFTATNTTGSDESSATSIVVNPAAPVWQSQPNAPDATVDVAYPGYDLGALLNTTSGVSIAVTQGTLPTGLSINPGTLVIEGTPTVIQNQTGIVYTASNVSGSAASNPDSIRIFPAAPNWDTQPSPPSGQVSEVYPPYDLAQHLNTTDLVVITDNGNLPPGLSINNSTYVIEGTPTQDGNFTNIVLTATNPAGSDQTLAFSIFIAPEAATVDIRLDNPVQSGKQVFDQGTEVVSGNGPGDVEADWQSRISGSSVVWYHDFRNQAEVDNFRWCAGYSSGNDPLDAGTSRAQNSVEFDVTDGISGGACLALSRNVGTIEGKDWWRPFSPMNGAGNGKGLDDPGAAGSIGVETWAPTDGGNQTSTWASGNYGPENTGEWEGNVFHLQLAMKLDSSRTGAGVSGGKINYITRTNQSLTAQELVTYYKFSNLFSIYTAGSPEVPSNIPNVAHIVDQWGYYLYRIVPGEEENVPNTSIEVWRMMDDETSYTKIFETFDQPIDYSDAFPKAWNALICSTYHNGINLPAFTQKYDQIIFSRDWIPEPGISKTEIYSACEALSAGQSATFNADPGNLLTVEQSEWQTDCYHDPMQNKIHVFGKAAGFSSAWSHEAYDIVTNTWSTVTSSLTGGEAYFGHIYGNNALNWYTGDLYQVPGGVNTASNRDVFEYNASTVSWSKKVDNFDPGGTWNDTANGVAIHPQLYGPNEPGVVIDQQISTVYIKLSDGSDESVPHGSNAYGQKEGVGLYWAHENAVIVGGSTGDSLAMITPNGGATPTRITLSSPPITTSGQSRGTDGGLVTGFGSLHVHPGNPAKLILIETAGPRAWTGEWSGSDINWTAIGNHPFSNPGNTPRIVCSLRGGLGCLWAIGRSSAGYFSVLWRPPV